MAVVFIGRDVCKMAFAPGGSIGPRAYCQFLRLCFGDLRRPCYSVTIPVARVQTCRSRMALLPATLNPYCKLDPLISDYFRVHLFDNSVRRCTDRPPRHKQETCTHAGVVASFIMPRTWRLGRKWRDECGISVTYISRRPANSIDWTRLLGHAPRSRTCIVRSLRPIFSNPSILLYTLQL